VKKYTKDFTNLTTQKVTGKGIVEEKEEKEIVGEKIEENYNCNFISSLLLSKK
jgi:hypothetical protein